MIAVIGPWHTYMRAGGPRCGHPGGAVPPGIQFGGGHGADFGSTGRIAFIVAKILPRAGDVAFYQPPHHLDPSALSHPVAGHFLRSPRSAAPGRRGRIHAAGALKRMWQTDDQKLAEDLRKLDDEVDDLYSAIKYYMTQDFARRTGQARRAAAGPTSSASPSIWSRWATLVERVLRTWKTRRSKRGASFPKRGWKRSTA